MTAAFLAGACLVLGAAGEPGERTLDTITATPVRETEIEQVVPRWTAPGRPTVAVALSGGGARGIAHVGVLEAMIEDGVEIDAIAGTSFGAIIGAFFAAGYAPGEVEGVLRERDWNDVLAGLDRRNRILAEDEDLVQASPVFRVRLRGRQQFQVGALVDSRRLARLLYRYLLRAQVDSRGDFDRLRIPFRPVAADVLTGDAVVPRGGDLVTAVLGSAAFPGVFRPVPFGDALLVDGGMVENIPVSAARGFGRDVVLAVDVSEGVDADPNIGNALDLLDRSVNVLMEAQRKRSLAAADLVLSPKAAEFSTSDFRNVAGLVEAGRASYRSVRERLWALLEARASDGGRLGYDRVEVAGSALVDPAELAGRLGGPSGSVSRYRVAAELARLLNSGPFDDGRVDRVETGSGERVLRFLVCEAPEVRGVSVRGVPMPGADDEMFDILGRPLSSETARTVSWRARQGLLDQGRVLVALDDLEWDAATSTLRAEVRDAPVGRVTLDVLGDVHVGRIRRFLDDLQGREFRFDSLADRLDELVVRGSIVSWSLSPVMRDDGVVDLTVKVRGDQYYELTGSLEYRDELGWAGYVRATKSNVTSRGDFLELVLAGASETRWAQVRYRTEYGAGFGNYGGEIGVRWFDGSYPFVDDDQDVVDRLEEDYDGLRSWLTFIRRLRWGAVIQAGAAWQRENLEATDTLPREQRSRTALTLTLDLDRRDRLLFPTRGASFRLRGEHGISGDDLWKYELATDAHVSAGARRRQTYSVRAGAGVSDGADRRPYFFNPGGYRAVYGFTPYGTADAQYARLGATGRYLLFDLGPARIHVEGGADVLRTTFERGRLDEAPTRCGYGASVTAQTDLVGAITLGVARNDEGANTVFFTVGYGLFDR